MIDLILFAVVLGLIYVAGRLSPPHRGNDFGALTLPKHHRTSRDFWRS